MQYSVSISSGWGGGGINQICFLKCLHAYMPTHDKHAPVLIYVYMYSFVLATQQDWIWTGGGGDHDPKWMWGGGAQTIGSKPT